MREYDDAYASEPMENDDTGPWSCPDPECTGHTRPGERCVEPDWDDFEPEPEECP